MENEIRRHSTNEVVLSRINEFRKTGKFCDVKLVVGDVEFPAHKAMLAGFSPFFEGMFSGNFAETKQDPVKLDSIDLSIMESLLEYAYTSRIEITSENVPAFLHAADFLQVKELFELCCEWLRMNITTESCVAVYKLSEFYSYPNLARQAREFILTNFSNVCTEVDFLELGGEKLIDLIDDRALLVEEEEQVFDAVLQWFHYKPEEREAILPKVISHVRLTNLDSYFLHTRLKTTDALLKSEACMKLFLEVFSYKALPHRRAEILPSFAKPRDTARKAQVLMITGHDLAGNRSHLCVTEEGRIFRTFLFPSGCDLSTVSATSSYDLFYLDSGKIVFFDDLNWRASREESRSDRSKQIFPYFVVPPRKALHNFDGRWYTFGLLESDCEIKWFDDSHLVDPPSWRAIPPMLEVVHNPGVTSVDGMMYLAGGKTENKTPSRRLQRYDPFTKSWSAVSYLPVPWKSLKVCAINRQIYVFSDNSPDDSSIEEWRLDVYCVSSNQWKECSKIPKKFKNHIVLKTVAFQGDIYVLIEKDNNLDILVYSPSNDSWRNFRILDAPADFNICTFRGPFLIART